MDEEVKEEFTDHTIKDVHSTQCDHFLFEDPNQDPKSDLTSVLCSKCWSGFMISDDQCIEDGKIVKRKLE
jgi:hypothetical protein